MKKKLFIVIIVVVLFSVSGCENNNHGEKNDVNESNKSSVEYDVDNLLEKQKIVFIMSVSSYAEPYVEGYFIDTKGKKHIYGLYEQAPFESIEKEYAYLLEHYDEFEMVDFWDDTTLKNCTEYLYHVNIDSERKTEGTTIMDYPLKQLYGIRVIDDNEEFVFLESETGITERLDDPSAAQIYEEFGEEWYVLR